MAQLQRTSEMDQQAQDETSTKKEARERMSLEPWLQDIVHPNTGAVLGKGLVLGSASHLQANDEHRETYGGLIANFVDPKTNRKCQFPDRNTGDMRDGGCPVRIFEDDAAALARSCGEPVGKDSQLLLLLDPKTDAAVYRKEDGSMSFLVLRKNQILGAAIVVSEIKRLF